MEIMRDFFFVIFYLIFPVDAIYKRRETST